MNAPSRPSKRPGISPVRVNLFRERSYPSLLHIEGRNFRREYKGSVLERAAQKSCQKGSGGVFSSLLRLAQDWSGLFGRKALQKSSESTKDRTADSFFETLPSELLLEIFRNLDKAAATTCRAVCTRWKRIIENEHSESLFPPKTLSRLTIRGVRSSSSKNSRHLMEVRWVDYNTQSSQAIVISTNSPPVFTFAFSQFNIQRLILQEVPLSPAIVGFLRDNLSACRQLSPAQLSLISVDFSAANALTLHELLAVVGRSLETLELQGCTALREGDLTDTHLSQLDASKVRRVVVDGVSLSPRSRSLSLGDSSLRAFMAVGNFPTLVLDRCAVTTGVVCDYTQEWLRTAEREENAIHRSQVCTVKRCHSVTGTGFEEECARRGLLCRQQCAPPCLTLYSIQSENGNDEFTVALCTAAPKETPAAKEGVEEENWPG